MKKMFWWLGRKKPVPPTDAQTAPDDSADIAATDEANAAAENLPEGEARPDGVTDTAAENLPDGDTSPDGAPPLKSKKTGRFWSNKRIIVLSIVGALVLILFGVGAYAYSIWNDPMAQFSNVADQITPPPKTAQTTDDSSDPATPDPSPTIDPYDALLAQADTGFLKDIVNIMLIGVDHSEERNTWSGKKAFHADVMIVLAVNKATGEVNMISLPRDTYAEIPGVKGIYKLNASIDCGGGWPTEGGFNKVCEAAEWMLGGIPVDYYYAVDMNAVKQLVDAIGGVQGFDVEMDFKMQGRSYTKGVQDMNGQAVLDYLRVRKGVSEAGDLNRIARQKKMLVAIFEKIKQNGLLTGIPGLLDAFDGNMYTNTTLAQTAALAAFAYHVDTDGIGMYSMGGRYNYGIFNWNFVLTDQDARVKLIKQIYGVDVDIYKDYTASAAVARWNRMQLPVVRSRAKAVLSSVKSKLDADAKLPIYGEATPTPAPTTPPTPAPATPTPPPATPTPPPETTPPETTPPETTPPETTPPETPTTATPTETATETPLGIPENTGESLFIARLQAEALPLSGPDASSSGITLLSTPAGYRKYLPGGREWSLYNKASSAVNSLSGGNVAQVKSDIESLCRMFSISVPSWKVNYESSNEVDVDFR